MMDVTPPSMSLAPAEAPARGPVTRSLTPLTVVPSCLVPLEVVVSGLARAHCPVVAVSVPFGWWSSPGWSRSCRRIPRSAAVLELVSE